jgi:hypothetical protein
MKKAKDYLNAEIKGLIPRDYSKEDLDYHTIYLSTALKLIKLAQEDAIRETVERCLQQPYLDLSTADKLIKEL